jgi:hypothetical protein
MDEVRASVQVELYSRDGLPDSGVAVMTDKGIYLETVFGEGAGISWKLLARLLEHPQVAEKLAEIDWSFRGL